MISLNFSLCRRLDYDFLGPDHKYEFEVIATDNDPVAPKSGSVTVQVGNRFPVDVREKTKRYIGVSFEHILNTFLLK